MDTAERGTTAWRCCEHNIAMHVSTNFFIQCKCYNGIDTFTNNCRRLEIYSEDQQYLHAPVLQPTMSTPDVRGNSTCIGSSLETWLPM